MLARRIALTVVLGLAAVGWWSGTAGAASGDSLCRPVELGAERSVLRTTDPSTLSLPQVRRYLERADAWLAQVVRAVRDESSAEYREFRAAVDDFHAAVKGLSSGSRAENAATVRAASKDVQRTGQDLFEAVGC